MHFTILYYFILIYFLNYVIQLNGSMGKRRQKIEPNIPTDSKSKRKLENTPNTINLKAKREGKCAPNLPQDIIREIFWKLSPNSIAKLRHACKFLYELTSEKWFISSYISKTSGHLSILCELCEGICLISGITVSGRKLVASTWKLPLAKQDANVVNPEKPRNVYLFMHCEGMLCYITTYATYCDYTVGNPTTKEWITVKSPTATPILQCVYHHPPSGEYRMLWGSNYHTQYQQHSILSLGKNNLRRIEDSTFPTDWRPSDYRGKSSPLLLDGKVHMFCSWRKIAVFDIESEKFSQIGCPALTLHNEAQMVEIAGKLCILEFNGKSAPFNVKVWVLENYSTGTWYTENLFVRDARTSEMPGLEPLTFYRDRIVFVKYLGNDNAGGQNKWHLRLLKVQRLTKETVFRGMVYKFGGSLATFRPC